MNGVKQGDQKAPHPPALVVMATFDSTLNGYDSAQTTYGNGPHVVVKKKMYKQVNTIVTSPALL